MALSPLSRPTGMLSVTAAVLIVLSQVMRLGVGGLLGQNWVTTPAYTVTSSIALLLMGALLLALTVIYTPGPSCELDLGPSRAGRTAAGYPRAPADRPDGTARPRPAGGRRRLTCLRPGGLARFIWAIRTVRPPLSAPSPLTGATTELIPATR
jgi:hypothetical protein